MGRWLLSIACSFCSLMAALVSGGGCLWRWLFGGRGQLFSSWEQWEQWLHLEASVEAGETTGAKGLDIPFLNLLHGKRSQELALDLEVQLKWDEVPCCRCPWPRFLKMRRALLELLLVEVKSITPAWQTLYDSSANGLRLCFVKDARYRQVFFCFPSALADAGESISGLCVCLSKAEFD